MKSVFVKSTLTASLLFYASLTSAAFAQDTVTSKNTWANYDFHMTYSGNGFAKKMRATVDNGEAIYTTSVTSPGLLFTCLAQHFSVSVSLKPQDLRKVLGRTSSRIKIRHVDMRLDDGSKVALGTWLYQPALGGISARKRSHAAKLYNAVIHGQKVTLYMDSQKPVILDFPKPNSAFADFGTECGIGRNKPK